jgi:hypothetical protein
VRFEYGRDKEESPSVQGLLEPLVFFATKPIPTDGFSGVGEPHRRGFRLFGGF